MKSIKFGKVAFECSEEINGEEVYTTCYGKKTSSKVTIKYEGKEFTIPIRYLVYFVGEIVKLKRLKELEKQKENLQKEKSTILFGLE